MSPPSRAFSTVKTLCCLWFPQKQTLKQGFKVEWLIWEISSKNTDRGMGSLGMVGTVMHPNSLKKKGCWGYQKNLSYQPSLEIALAKENCLSQVRFPSRHKSHPVTNHCGVKNAQPSSPTQDDSEGHSSSGAPQGVNGGLCLDYIIVQLLPLLLYFSPLPSIGIDPKRTLNKHPAC